MSRLWELLRGATLADASVLLALLALGAALLAPTWSARQLRDRVAAAIADVEVVAGAARTTLDLQHRWPTATRPGEAPPELAALSGADGPFARAGYTLGWTTWQVVDSAAAPPEPPPPPTPGDPPRPTGPRMIAEPRTVGAVTLRSGEETLLAELVRHFGRDAAFVLDTTWVLVLPERASPAPTGAR